MLIAYIPLLVALVGLLMYALCSNAKLAEIGRILFFCGAFFAVYATAGTTVKLFGH